MQSAPKEAALQFASRLRTLIFETMDRDICAALRLARFYGTYLFDNFIGIYGDAKLELRLADELFPSIKLPAVPKAGNLLHMATELYNWGGHTRVIERFLNAGFGDAVALLSPMPRELREKFPSSIRVLDRLRSLDDINTITGIVSKGLAYETIMLHIHQNDIYSSVAAIILARAGRRILFYNHADHGFSFGYAAPERVLEISKYGWVHGSYRGIDGKQSFVGIPVECPKLPIPRSRPSKRIIMCGSPYKFIPFGDCSVPRFLNILGRMLDHKFSIHLIGPTGQEPYWNDLNSSVRRRITFHGVVDHDRFQDLLLGCEAYIDSFPLGNGTAFPEAVLAGIPCFGLDLLAGVSYADTLRSNTIEDLIRNVSEQLSHEGTRGDFHDAREKTRLNQSPEACICRAYSIIPHSENIPLPLEYRTARCREDFFEQYWAYFGCVKFYPRMLSILKLKERANVLRMLPIISGYVPSQVTLKAFGALMLGAMIKDLGRG